MTFWGTEFFKSVDENEVRYGENVDAYFQWPVKVEEGAGSGSSFAKTVIVVSFAICGPLLFVL